AGPPPVVFRGHLTVIGDAESGAARVLPTKSGACELVDVAEGRKSAYRGRLGRGTFLGQDVRQLVGEQLAPGSSFWCIGVLEERDVVPGCERDRVYRSGS